jgi:hypothetical protein
VDQLISVLVLHFLMLLFFRLELIKLLLFLDNGHSLFNLISPILLEFLL